MIRDLFRNWSQRGLPRCAGLDFMTEQRCGRLIWPWQQTAGIGSPVHPWCAKRYWASRNDWIVFDEMPDAELLALQGIVTHQRQQRGM